MQFDNLDSRPGKSWNFGPGPGKSWNFMLANVYAAELPTVLDCLTCMRENLRFQTGIMLFFEISAFASDVFVSKNRPKGNGI